MVVEVRVYLFFRRFYLALRTSPNRSLKLLARWIVFTTALSEVIPLLDGRLRGCALCISRNGAIAVVAVDEAQLYVYSDVY